MRRWDGFVARGEGAAEAARLEAANRLAELEAELPARRAMRDAAQAAQASAQETLADLQRSLVASERAVGEAAETERQALRAFDQAEAARERIAARLAELENSAADLADQRKQADADLADARDKRSALPDPEAGRAKLEAAQAKNEAARSTMQAATAQLAAHDQALAVARERTAAQRSDMANWQARSGEAAQRLSEMDQRFEEIAEERAVIAAKPEGLIREIEQGDAVRARLGEELAEAEAYRRRNRRGCPDFRARSCRRRRGTRHGPRNPCRSVGSGRKRGSAAQPRWRKHPASASSAPRPCSQKSFGFDADEVGPQDTEAQDMERLSTSRERIGPVNLVAADELERIESEHGASAAEQAELAEAVNRLRGSIGNLNREGRERLRAAFEQVDTHFRRPVHQPVRRRAGASGADRQRRSAGSRP